VHASVLTLAVLLLLQGGKDLGEKLLPDYMRPGSSMYGYFGSWLTTFYEGLKNKVDSDDSGEISSAEFLA